MVRLVIKAPNQKIDDCEVYADLGWTVAQVSRSFLPVFLGPSIPALVSAVCPLLRLLIIAQHADQNILFLPGSHCTCDRS